MDPLTARIWEASEHRGNALLLLILIGHSIAEGNPRPKLDDLASRFKKMSRRQIERLESALVASQELQIIDTGGRGRGNLYDVPAIRPLLSARIQAEFAGHDARRLAAALSESPTDAAGFPQSPTETTGEESPTDAAGFKPESPTDAAGKAESPTYSARIQSRPSISLKTDLNKEKDKEGGLGETKPRRGRQKASDERPFPADFALDESDLAWAREHCPGLDASFATGSWADNAKSKGRTYSDWKAAWRNGMRNAYKWALEAGTIQRAPAPAQTAAPVAPPGDQAEYEQNRQLLNQPCSECVPFGIGEADPACENCRGTGREPLAKILAGMK